MSQVKLLAIIACMTLIGVETASANPWNHPRHYYGYGYRPVYAYPPVVMPPPPVVVAPAYPPPVYYAPAPVYAPPVYYGGFGPRGYGFGYASPGFGVFIR